MQTAEAARIVISQHPAIVEREIPVIVGLQSCAELHQAQAPRHPQVQDQGAGVEADQEVFRAPLDRTHGLSANGGLEVGGNRPAQAALAHGHIEDAPLEQRGRNPASGRFYFRKLGRVTARTLRRLLDLRFFVRDVLAHDRIEFLRFHLVGMQTLVLGGGVIVPGAG